MSRTPRACTWVKSSYSETLANCVEVSASPSTTAVRDSKRPDGPIVRFSPSAWTALVRSKGGCAVQA
ncbi:DUF397 domain-containing protein [Uniformispora flossi]|uniref:DUF397 domain-containing protein n=1 Tax=Uniformispora flossi TaxID=3390723 RepID=UPI003C305FAA